jgi:hypothetical protein
MQVNSMVCWLVLDLVDKAIINKQLKQEKSWANLVKVVGGSAQRPFSAKIPG